MQTNQHDAQRVSNILTWLRSQADLSLPEDIQLQLDELSTVVSPNQTHVFNHSASDFYSGLNISDERRDMIKQEVNDIIDRTDKVSELFEGISCSTNLSIVEKMYATYVLGYSKAKRDSIKTEQFMSELMEHIIKG